MTKAVTQHILPSIALTCTAPGSCEEPKQGVHLLVFLTGVSTDAPSPQPVIFAAIQHPNREFVSPTLSCRGEAQVDLPHSCSHAAFLALLPSQLSWILGEYLFGTQTSIRDDQVASTKAWIHLRRSLHVSSLALVRYLISINGSQVSSPLVR